MKKTLLLLLAAMLLVGANVKATNFISEIRVSTHTNQATAKSQLTDADYTVIDQDMNQGGGGHYVYIGYKTSTNLADAITGLYVVSGSSWAGDEGKTFTNNGCTFRAVSYTSDSKGGNLNRGRGASAYDLYLYYTKDGNTTNSIYSAYMPITSLTAVSSTSSQSVNTYVEFYNLTGFGYANTNTGGSASNYIYLNVTSRHTCSLTYELVSAGHRQYCSVCGYTRSTAACTFTGNYIAFDASQCYRVCSVCNLRTYINHNWSGRYSYLNATQCFNPCANCGYQKKENHVWTNWQSYSTEQHRHVCARCNYTAFENHNWSYAYSPSTPSYHIMSCSVSTCGYYKTEAHTTVTDAAAVPATCTTAGSTIAEHCRYCTYAKAATALAALGHQFDEYGVCTRTAGQRHYSHALGDVTCNGEISLGDVTKLVQAIKTNHWANADYNNDGVLDLADIEALVDVLLHQQ